MITHFAHDPGFWGMPKRKKLPFAALSSGLIPFSFLLSLITANSLLYGRPDYALTLTDNLKDSIQVLFIEIILIFC